MTYLKGIPVILVDKVEIGNDDFGHPIHRDVEIEVQNVLGCPNFNRGRHQSNEFDVEKRNIHLVSLKETLTSGRTVRLSFLVANGGRLASLKRELSQ